MLSRIASVTARGQAGDYLAPACLRAVEPGRLARRETQEGVEAFASQPPVVSEAAAAVPPFAGGAVFAALPSDCRILPGVFEPVRIFFPVAIGGIAGMTASAAGSGGAVCPSTAAGGAVIFCFEYDCAGCWVWGLLCLSTSAAGAVTVGAATAMPA